MNYSHPLEPIIDKRTQILFLGSFPSLASFEHSFYYAHPRNAFWPILESIFNVKFEHNESKRSFCLTTGIGLWDVIGSCERTNSSDTNLKNCIPNDFYTCLREYPNIKALAFTGKKSYDLFKKYFKDLEVNTVLLPSTSPAYAAMSFEAKKEAYKQLFEEYQLLF